MIKYTQKQLRQMVAQGIATDVTRYHTKEADELRKSEKWLRQIGFSYGVYGCNGMLLKGEATGKLYAVTARTSAIYLF